MRRLRALHRLVSILIAALVPVCTFIFNGEVAAEVGGLGAVLGFAHWYWWTPTI